MLSGQEIPEFSTDETEKWLQSFLASEVENGLLDHTSLALMMDGMGLARVGDESLATLGSRV